ncbi:hypothetical protein [Chromobacterium haemolyticum]|uniref:hypothetical protein n=1 Tax=Chromobacterium haemolyticum TaxID=394935 RepID=UPI001FEE51E3|nr:hypothetical protein [Chromobacterium haemolyticum]
MMRLSDLLPRPGGRRLSHSRLWANIACAAATLLFVVEGLRGTLGADIWLIYLGIVGGYSAGLRLIAAWRDRGGR